MLIFFKTSVRSKSSHQVVCYFFVSLQPNSIVPLKAYQQTTFTSKNATFDPTVGINCNAPVADDPFLRLCKQNNEFISESS